MATLRLAVASLLGAAALGSSASVPHERRGDHHHSHWAKRDRMFSEDRFQMRIALAQQNLHKGFDWLMDVSDPRSSNYGLHWTQDEVAKKFAPAAETIKAAQSWVTAAGIPDESVSLAPGGGWLLINTTVEQAEDLLQAEYWIYESADGGLAVGADEYSIPSELKPHVEFVYPAVALGEMQSSELRRRKRSASNRPKRQISPRDNSTCANMVTPRCIAAWYNIPAADKAHPNNSLGIYEQISWYQNDDLDLFFASFATNIPQGTRPQNLSIDEAEWFYDTNDTYISIATEADLDLDAAYPIVYPQNITVFQTDDIYYTDYSLTATGIFNTFLDALDSTYCNYSAFGETGDSTVYDPVYPDTHSLTGPEGETLATYKGERMCGVYQPTNVISISYAVTESLWSEAYQMRQCNEFMKLGLQGVSVVLASGDSGPLSSLSCQATNLGSFWVKSPVNCPYVTTVGATQFFADGTETAVQSDEWASSGGFSAYYPRPAYQDEAVGAYLEANNLSSIASLFNASNRGVPDLAAVGASIAVAVNYELTTADGTSAAAPIVAAMLNRVNEERLAVGKGPVGFVNPVLYANASQIFNDITVGNSNVCGITGYQAVEGWDPVTGLGTPDYAKLLSVFLALP
ncbi:peptidase S8/S53 domain-containing protein [Xylariales sp. PMI_506]|nr:peptidase S8/S53 domain-containing protein [Xylariales sp. PMI_506]